MMNKEEIEYCLKEFRDNKHAFRFENGLKISMYKVFEQLEDLQQRIDKAKEYIKNVINIWETKPSEIATLDLEELLEILGGKE